MTKTHEMESWRRHGLIPGFTYVSPGDLAAKRRENKQTKKKNKQKKFLVEMKRWLDVETN